MANSGDGSLSVIDVRTKKTEPLAQSEDQEDELLSIVPIKGCARQVNTRNDAHVLTCIGDRNSLSALNWVYCLFSTVATAGATAWTGSRGKRSQIIRIHCELIFLVADVLQSSALYRYPLQPTFVISLITVDHPYRFVRRDFTCRAAVSYEAPGHRSRSWRVSH